LVTQQPFAFQVIDVTANSFGGIVPGVGGGAEKAVAVKGTSVLLQDDVL
jgi:hypothetical protein